MIEQRKRIQGGHRDGGLLLALALAVGLLHGCGSVPRSGTAAQVEDRSGMPAPAPTPAPATRPVPDVAAYTPPAAPRAVRAEPQRAVGVLMRRAEDQRRAGELDAATVSLERALRIAPDDAVLWHELARLRLEQKRHALVPELAAKSNALAASGDISLRRANLELIAAARRALGDPAGARAAEREAAALQ
jgi:hypothetical protein